MVLWLTAYPTNTDKSILIREYIGVFWIQEYRNGWYSREVMISRLP